MKRGTSPCSFITMTTHTGLFWLSTTYPAAPNMWINPQLKIVPNKSSISYIFSRCPFVFVSILLDMVEQSTHFDSRVNVWVWTSSHAAELCSRLIWLDSLQRSWLSFEAWGFVLLFIFLDTNEGKAVKHWKSVQTFKKLHCVFSSSLSSLFPGFLLKCDPLLGRPSVQPNHLTWPDGYVSWATAWSQDNMLK